MEQGLVSVLLPTTGRKERALACVAGLLDTVSGWPIEVICPVDADRETATALRALLTSHLPTDRWKVPYHQDYHGCSASWNYALSLSAGEYICFAADDLIWSDGWLDAAMSAMRTLPAGGGLVGFNDGHWDGNELSTHYLMSRWFVLHVLGGVVAWDWYEHSFNDLEINMRAKAAKRFVWAEGAHVRHEHWTYGQRPQDATDTRMLTGYERSRNRYEQRKAQGFPIDYQAVITA